MRLVSLARSLVLTSVASIFASSTYGAVTSSTSFSLHAFGTTDCRLVIDVDEPVLVPSLTSIRISPENLKGIVPYRNSDQGRALLKELEGHPELSLGHTALYFYLAVNHALARLNHSLVLVGSANRSASENEIFEELDSKYGKHGSVGDRDVLFANLRDIAKVRPVSGKVLRLQVFFSKSRFDEESVKIGLHSAKAFWDPPSMRIGIYFDANIFRWYKEQGLRDGQSASTSTQQVRDYVIRQSMESIAHELVHFIQESTGNTLSDRPFLAEGAALVAQANIVTRENINRLVEEQLRRRLPMFPQPGTPCAVMLDLAPPVFSSALTQFQRGVEVAKAGLPLKRLLTVDNERFYAQDALVLKAQYDGAFAFVIFAAAMSREEFVKDVGPLLNGRRGAVPSHRLESLSRGFTEWAKKTASNWWDSETADDHYQMIKRLTSACMASRHYVAAYMGAEAMFALRPSSPMPFVYAGDVFYRLNMPFFAFDLYALANTWRSRFGVADASTIQIDSRIGDALEQVGDVKKSLEWFSRVASIEVKDVPLGDGITFLRTKLKREFYEAAVAGGYAREDRALWLLNSYVNQLHGDECVDDDGVNRVRGSFDAILNNKPAEFWALQGAHYRVVNDQMRADRTENELERILSRRDDYCSAVN